MNYLYQLEEKRRLLKNMIISKEDEFTNCISTFTNNNGKDIISKFFNKLSLLTTFTDGIRVGISILKLFYK